MRFAKIVTFIGIGLLVLAWVLAAFIPSQANEDLASFNQVPGSGLSQSANFPEMYKQMSANCRMLQNFYIGATGLICLGAGLSCWKKSMN